MVKALPRVFQAKQGRSWNLKKGSCKWKSEVRMISMDVGRFVDRFVRLICGSKYLFRDFLVRKSAGWKITSGPEFGICSF